MEDKELIRVEHLKKYFPVNTGVFGKKDLKAVDDVSLSIHEGETVALVGESGCGKSTLGRAIINMYPPTAGDIYFKGEKVKKKNLDKYMCSMQMIFQDPLSALNPRMTIADIIAEPMIVTKMYKSKEDAMPRVYELMEIVGLRKDYASRYPHEFSGGQCQRIGIARTLSINPEFIVCDEPVSALDVSVKAQIINMFGEIQKKTGIAYLFITHDLLTARYISHRIAVMYLGKIVEIADTDEVYDRPAHPYTKALLSAITVPDPEKAKSRNRILLEGEIPSPMHVPSGCPFRTRCRYAIDKCASECPDLMPLKGDKTHMTACWNNEKEEQDT